MPSHQTVLILDYGSQYTQLIARRVRELGFHSKILPGDSTLHRIQDCTPSAVILSGGPSSVYEEGAPRLAAGLIEDLRKKHVAILGICYGMQLLVQELGGEIKRAQTREYGRVRVIPEKASQFFEKVGVTFEKDGFEAWMSHGDETAKPPVGFKVSAKSAFGSVAAIENTEIKIYGLQFHPEVTHTDGGKQLLQHFLSSLAGLGPNWTMESVLQNQVDLIRAKVGPTGHAICALSGGVDSAVAAVLVHRAIGDRLHCVFVDHGLQRLHEREQVMELFEKKLKLPVKCADASERFLSKLQGVTDPEQKRKIIGAEFIAVFDAESKLLEAQLGTAPEFLVQGTLYPDVIESSAGHKHSAVIKSHHNVGGLPKEMKLKLIEPLRDLFKDEVRELGKKLGVPVEFLRRHPFPGPGLAVRILGEITPERLDILRQVDHVFIHALHRAGLYDSIWQAFAVFLPIRSVGVQGDGRTHDHVVALRAVTSHDGMTADWYPFDHKFLAAVSNEICNSVKGVNRVVYDVSSKPPATIEWE